VIARNETEWVEIAESGVVILASPNEERIFEAVTKCLEDLSFVSYSHWPGDGFEKKYGSTISAEE
jgi:UDP-N-acetylglucosamine 2-epimerase